MVVQAQAAVARHLRSHLPALLGDHPITFSQFPGGKANLSYANLSAGWNMLTGALNVRRK